ncbi:hypothetical protein N7474_001709 [Penicillium riverlandense]|uniref:uncharacterized protein n=1 Tax=Penicillium riverlandense TaxID=1903569 RepID=UPI002549BE68|nr:uncharacterized protein N7474_001709 [Penicillium riverlandense]KAJ5833398.1 hypothetical protein N7474_001709 [Penicillium riverlandense]
MDHPIDYAVKVLTDFSSGVHLQLRRWRVAWRACCFRMFLQTAAADGFSPTIIQEDRRFGSGINRAQTSQRTVPSQIPQIKSKHSTANDN